MPSFAIVCGPPASGKSLLASHLGAALAIPVISKDMVKEPIEPPSPRIVERGDTRPARARFRFLSEGYEGRSILR